MAQPDLLPEQLQVLRHALGLDRKAIAFRNHFCADVGHSDWPSLESLCSAGLMVKRRSALGPGSIFFVTDAGRSALAKLRQA